MINIYFDLQLLPRNYVTRFVQAAATRRRPEHRELGRTQFNLALLSRCAATDLECQRCGLAFFSETNVPASSFVGEIALRQLGVPSAQNSDRQMFDQKLSFDLAR